jgi:hypothetical protein
LCSSARLPRLQLRVSTAHSASPLPSQRREIIRVLHPAGCVDSRGRDASASPVHRIGPAKPSRDVVRVQSPEPSEPSEAPSQHTSVFGTHTSAHTHLCVARAGHFCHQKVAAAVPCRGLASRGAAREGATGLLLRLRRRHPPLRQFDRQPAEFGLGQRNLPNQSAGEIAISAFAFLSVSVFASWLEAVPKTGVE